MRWNHIEASSALHAAADATKCDFGDWTKTGYNEREEVPNPIRTVLAPFG
jgi:hypothetical protein